MGHHVISLDPFNPFSVMAAQQETRRLMEEFDRKVDEFIREVAEIGAKAAEGSYGGSVTVTIEGYDDGVSICADGKAVVFMEFGSGSAVATGNMFAGEMPFEVRPGSWSEQHAHQYERLGYWIFGGQKFTEVAPRNGMENAHKAIQQDMWNVAMRVFA